MTNCNINNCLFCESKNNNRVIAQNQSVFAIRDKYPVTVGHHLVIPKRHVEDVFQMSETEINDAYKMIFHLKDLIQNDDPTVSGFNIGMNCGKSAGQTVLHAHIHLIPRRNNDIDDPRGGIRGCIPDRMKY